VQDVIKARQAVGALDLGNDLDVAAARLVQHLADEAHVISGLHEGGCHEVHLVLAAELLDVVHVLLSQHRQPDLHTRQVAVLALSQLLGIEAGRPQLSG